MKYVNYDFSEIKDHQELFGHPFAQHGQFAIGFGVNKNSADNPTDVQISFTTPRRVVNEVSYYTGSYITNGGRVLVVSDHENAEPEDEGVVGFVKTKNGKSAKRLSMFVNTTSTDPAPPIVHDGTQPEPYAKPRTTWLKPETQYFVRLYRTDLNSAPPAMNLETVSY